jgi:hypothetical protein
MINLDATVHNNGPHPRNLYRARRTGRCSFTSVTAVAEPGQYLSDSSRLTDSSLMLRREVWPLSALLSPVRSTLRPVDNKRRQPKNGNGYPEQVTFGAIVPP